MRLEPSGMSESDKPMENVQGADAAAAPAVEENAGAATENVIEEIAEELVDDPTADYHELIEEDAAPPEEAAAKDDAETVASEEAIDAEAAYQAAIAQLEQDIQTLRLQLDDRQGQFARLTADFDNFRKRTQREREEMELKIKCDTINELLPVVDNFERARSQIKPQTDGETTIHKSYQSVYKQLVDCLKRIGVAPMRAEGKEFDPNLHEAVMREATDQYEEGVVMEELQRGYMLGERVLRHSLVKVAAPPDPSSSSADDQGEGVEDASGE